MIDKNVKTIDYGPVHNTHGCNVRWVENVSRGLRLVGFADKIVSINHDGWYIMDDGDGGETYRGVVYQLPARGGVEQYVYGYADPCNDDCALLCFIVETDRSEAAHMADRLAEIFAEHERDYHRACDAGQRYEALADEIKELRTKALTLGAEMRAARAAKLVAPTICATLRNQIMSLYRRIQKIRRDRAELLSDFGSCDGFADQ